MALDGSGGSSSNNNNDGRNRAEIPQESLKKGPWTEEEDKILKEHVREHGEGNWNSCQTLSGLMRCGKSCRLRWVNNLRPNLKKGAFSAEEEAKIVHLHAKFGSKWSLIACQLPGRTDNEIKNFWNTRVKRRQRACLPIYPDDATTHQESNLPSSSLAYVLPTPKQAQNPTSPAVISIYDVFRTTSSRKTTALPNNSHFSQPSGSSNLFHQNNGLSYEQNGEAYGQMQQLPSAELFAPMTTQTAFGNIGTSNYVSTTLNEAGGYEHLGLMGDLRLVQVETGKGIADPSSSFSDAAESHVHASIAAASPREINQVDDDFLSLLRTPALTMSMNDWFDKDGNIVPNNEHTPSFGGR